MVNKSNCEQPGLLRTCKQIRQEAERIFYQHNYIWVTITDYKLEPHPNHWVWRDTWDGPLVEVAFVSDKSDFVVWRNFMEWLKLYHAGGTKTRPQEATEDSPRVGFTVEAMFNIVDGLKECEWRHVQCALDAMNNLFGWSMMHLKFADQ